jgi:hypothetical protein
LSFEIEVVPKREEGIETIDSLDVLMPSVEDKEFAIIFKADFVIREQ